MIYKNGSMELICINGLMQEYAMFLRIPDNELIIARNCIWEDNSVSWGSGVYKGRIGDNLSNDCYCKQECK